jgi:hypothetical protein
MVMVCHHQQEDSLWVDEGSSRQEKRQKEKEATAAASAAKKAAKAALLAADKADGIPRYSSVLLFDCGRHP